MRISSGVGEMAYKILGRMRVRDQYFRDIIAVDDPTLGANYSIFSPFPNDFFGFNLSSADYIRLAKMRQPYAIMMACLGERFVESICEDNSDISYPVLTTSSPARRGGFVRRDTLEPFDADYLFRVLGELNQDVAKNTNVRVGRVAERIERTLKVLDEMIILRKTTQVAQPNWIINRFGDAIDDFLWPWYHPHPDAGAAVSGGGYYPIFKSDQNCTRNWLSDDHSPWLSVRNDQNLISGHQPGQVNHQWYYPQVVESGGRYVFLKPPYNRGGAILKNYWYDERPPGDTSLPYDKYYRWYAEVVSSQYIHPFVRFEHPLVLEYGDEWVNHLADKSYSVDIKIFGNWDHDVEITATTEGAEEYVFNLSDVVQYEPYNEFNGVKTVNFSNSSGVFELKITSPIQILDKINEKFLICYATFDRYKHTIYEYFDISGDSRV